MTIEPVREKLKEEGPKITPQRMAIVEALLAMRDFHPSARDVYREARKIRKSLSLSTTYATLSQLSAHGVIKTLRFDSRGNRREVNLKEHVNLICNGCGKIMAYKASALADLGEVEKRTGFPVTDTRLEYYDYCEECREERTGKGQGALNDSLRLTPA